MSSSISMRRAPKSGRRRPWPSWGLACRSRMTWAMPNLHLAGVGFGHLVLADGRGGLDALDALRGVPAVFAGPAVAHEFDEVAEFRHEEVWAPRSSLASEFCEGR